MARIIAGMFDNRGDAERTVEHLVQELSIDARDVEVHGTGAGAAPGSAAKPAGDAFPAPDRRVFREAVRRRGIVVVAHVKPAVADRAMDVFEEYGAVDLDAREAEWRGAGWAAEPGQSGYTGHDEDIGFATYGGDVVVGHIPRHHHDNTPAGLLGRFEMSAMRRDPDSSRSRVRSYIPG